MPKTTISTTEFAQLLSVNESTIKRWADNGNIECMRTQGGHRRFSIPSVMKFIQENKLNLPEIASRLFDKRELHAHLLSGNIQPLVDETHAAALDGDVEAVLALLQIALGANPDLLMLYSDILLPPLAMIGEDWRSGAISIDMEHLATNTIRQALIRFQSDVRRKKPNGLKAICACFEGENHDIGLYCVSSYLMAEGWRVDYMGADTPTQALVGAMNRRRPDLVVLSALIVEDEWKFLTDVSERILPAVRSIGGKLVIGGRDLPDRFGRKLEADAVFSSILDFRNPGKLNPPRRKNEGSAAG